MKLAATEDESELLRSQILRLSWRLAASELVRAELIRAASRKGPAEVAEAGNLLASLHLVPVSIVVLERAATVPPSELPTLDAIHIASAQLLGEDCEGIVTYDARMRDAARIAGFTVLAPGQGT